MSFLIPIKDLLNHPGNMQEMDLKIVLEGPIGTELVKLETGDALDIFLRLESVHEGILATGEVEAAAKTICSRCLDSMNLEIEVDFQELFAYSSTSDDELVVSGELIDLEQVVIDSVVLSLPFQPVCSPDCLGLCAGCGEKLSETHEHQHENPVDPRFNALKDLLSKEE
ncbi:MAG: DUF177 domain-containing protein [Aquiluna sp.]|nr:DUF177 domain-containing protein [Aquiluna sp.]MCF8545298.1 DUF177 domain-containing protein [Aquiluna sp.]